MTLDRTPKIVVEPHHSGRFIVVAEWSASDRVVLCAVSNREGALAAAGKAAVQWQSGPVIERELPR